MRAALRESEERLAMATKVADYGFWDWNIDTDQIYFSPRFCTMLGYEPEELPMEVATRDKLIHPDDRERVLPFLEEAAKEGIPYEITYRMRSKSGEWRWITGKGKLFEKDTEGRPSRIIGTQVDITEQKRAEIKIGHLNEVIHSIRNVNQLITKETDRERLIQRSCTLLTEGRGYFNTWIALFDEGQYVSSASSGFDGRFEPMRELLETGELTSCGKEATERPGVIVTGNPLEECVDCPLHTSYEGRSGYTIRLEHMDKVYGLLSASIPADLADELEEQSLFEEVAGDIGFALYKIEMETDRKRAEEELEITHKQLLDTIEFLPDATFVIDRGEKVIAWNRAIERMTGVPKEEIIGKGDFSYAVPFYGERRKILINLILSGDEKIESRYDYVRREGGTLFAEVFIPSLHAGNGAYIWATASPLYDEERNIIGAIESIRDITDRKEMESKLKLANEKLNLMGAITRHDILNQLTNITGYIELAEMEGDNGKYIKKAMNAAMSIKKILEMERGYEKLGSESAQWVGLKETCLTGVATVDKNDSKISVDIGDVEILADPMLEKVFHNLADNAIRHGGARHVRVFTEAEGDSLAIVVEDDGSGIKKDEKESVFRLGTGFGLYFSKELLSITGITIREEGEEGRGARFVMVVPKDMCR